MQSPLQAQVQRHQIAYVVENQRLIVHDNAQLGRQQAHPPRFLVPQARTAEAAVHGITTAVHVVTLPDRRLTGS